MINVLLCGHLVLISCLLSSRLLICLFFAKAEFACYFSSLVGLGLTDYGA